MIDGKGGYTLGGVSGTYTVNGDVATVVTPENHGYEEMTFALKSDGKLDVDFSQDYEAYSRTLTKTA